MKSTLLLSIILGTILLAVVVSGSDKKHESNQKQKKGTVHHLLQNMKGKKLQNKSCSEHPYPSKCKFNKKSAPWNYRKSGEDWMQGQCSGSFRQSPIDLPDIQLQCDSDYKVFDFTAIQEHPVEVHIIDNGHTFQSNKDWSKLEAGNLDGNTYTWEAVQFHIHAPSEHTVNGKQHEAELQIVHQKVNDNGEKSDDDLAIVSVFFDIGEFNNEFFEGWDVEKAVKPGDENDMNDEWVDFSILWEQINEVENRYYHYKGSQTTPPCSEIVSWYIFDTPLQIGRLQLLKLHNRWENDPAFASGNGNNRATQPLNDRKVKYLEMECEFKEPEAPKKDDDDYKSVDDLEELDEAEKHNKEEEILEDKEKATEGDSIETGEEAEALAEEEAKEDKIIDNAEEGGLGDDDGSASTTTVF